MTEIYLGDHIVPGAVMIYDQRRLINAPPAEVFPWLQQLGKGRAGWYLPEFWEWLFPASWRASRRIQDEWQHLSTGDIVPDYGFSADDYFEVVVVKSSEAIVFRSERYGCAFSWALLVHEIPSADRGSTSRSVVHLRFRGHIQAVGLRKRCLVWAGRHLDYITTAPLLAGLAERAEQSRGT